MQEQKRLNSALDLTGEIYRILVRSELIYGFCLSVEKKAACTKLSVTDDDNCDFIDVSKPVYLEKVSTGLETPQYS